MNYITLQRERASVITLEYRIIPFGMKCEELNYSKIIVTFCRARILGIVVN